MTTSIRSPCRRAATGGEPPISGEQPDAPYHEAAALAESPDEADLLEALAILDRIGAVPLARRVRAELRERGVRNIPRGPSTSTRRNPEGLTERQVGVLRLLAEGLTNAEIADRLVVSVRTVDSHVAAILDEARGAVASGRRAGRARARRALCVIEGVISVVPPEISVAVADARDPARELEWVHGSHTAGRRHEEGSSWTPHSP